MFKTSRKMGNVPKPYLVFCHADRYIGILQELYGEEFGWGYKTEQVSGDRFFLMPAKKFVK